jgi:protein-tyrosine sulfotransferase
MAAMADEACFALSDGTLVRPSIPFFITGSGRCGTTLMRRLIMERAHAVIPPENYVLASSLHLMEGAKGDWNFFCGMVLVALRQYSGRWEDFGIDQTTAFGLLTSIPGAFRTIANFWHAFHAIYANRVNKPSDTRWGDKTPSNVDGLSEVIQIFPQARFIFMVRDVYDMSYSLGSMATSGRAGVYLGGAKRWVDANAKILAFKQQYAAQAMLVRYEELARYPEREMAAVLAHLGVPSAAAGELNALEARDMAAHPDLRNALGSVRSDFIGKGRANLTDRVKEQIFGIAAPLQVSLGYEPTGADRFPIS